MDINRVLADEFKIKLGQVENTVKLIDEGNTIPFIARYRKEMTGSLDDVVLRNLFDRLTYLRNLEKRKEENSFSIATHLLTCNFEDLKEGAKTAIDKNDLFCAVGLIKIIQIR